MHAVISGIRSARERLPQPGYAVLALGLSLGLTAFCNGPFWKEMLRLRPANGLQDLAFLASTFLLSVAVLNVFFALVGFPILRKVVAVVVLNVSAIAAYFIGEYGVLLDGTMIQNVLETDRNEVVELLSAKLLLYLFALGVLPSILVCLVRVRARPLLRELAWRTGSVLASIAVIGLLLFVQYPEFASFFPRHRHLRHMITPINYLYGTARLLQSRLDDSPEPLRTVGADAAIRPRALASGKALLTVLVLGETARAESFELNGYRRHTNPRLVRDAVVSFDNVWACGTSTAVSVPCMFSPRGGGHFDGSTARHEEGLLDVMAHAGVNVMWRDNNSGCKGVCDRIEVQDLDEFRTEELCDSRECFDEVLLNRLDDYLANLDGEALIVLHQKGSHGPAYYRRYPGRFAEFAPACQSNQLQDCARQEIVNAYDNTILYTDYFLDHVIDVLKSHADRFDTAMLYMSDHGESLGTGNIYLHGLPYFMAPEEQKRVPFVVWLSEDLQRDSGIDAECLATHHGRRLSHDNLFHTLLGLMNVTTGVYSEELDAFASCRGSSAHEHA